MLFFLYRGARGSIASGAGLFFLVAFYGCLLCGCCPGVKKGDSQTSSGTDGSSGSVGAARFSAIQQSLFDRHCVTDCHETLITNANLSLSREKSYQNLVNKASQQLATQLRVAPGKPDQSYLVRKLVGGSGIVGEQMPRLAPPRPSSEIDQVREWIARGAPND